MATSEVTLVDAPLVHCSGPAGAGHRAIAIDVSAGRTASCPLCGSRFQRASPSRIDPAVWPKHE